MDSSLTNSAIVENNIPEQAGDERRGQRSVYDLAEDEQLHLAIQRSLNDCSDPERTVCDSSARGGPAPSWSQADSVHPAPESELVLPTGSFQGECFFVHPFEGEVGSLPPEVVLPGAIVQNQRVSVGEEAAGGGASSNSRFNVPTDVGSFAPGSMSGPISSPWLPLAPAVEGPSVDAQVHRALELAGQKLFEEAEACLDALVRADPSRASTREVTAAIEAVAMCKQFHAAATSET